MTKELKQKIDKIVRDYYMSSKASTLYRNLKGLAYNVAEEATKELEVRIEKMKVCDNCKFGQNRCYLKDGTGKACDKWEFGDRNE